MPGIAVISMDNYNDSSKLVRGPFLFLGVVVAVVVVVVVEGALG
jgi:hypothetical protein